MSGPLLLNAFKSPPAAIPRVRIRAANPRDAVSRRGVTMVLSIAILASVITVIAFALEIEHLSISRNELQRSADATAIGACWQMFDDRVSGTSDKAMTDSVKSAAAALAGANPIAGASPQLSDQFQDVQFGVYKMPEGEFTPVADSSLFNSVRINVRRQNGINGEIPLFFSKLLKRDSQPLQSSATAATFSQIVGFHAPAEGENLMILPIAIDLETWLDVVAGNTPDVFSADDASNVSAGSDGFHECNLYPQGTGSPGNRGTVDIGGNNNSTADLRRQILHGISREDMIKFGRPLEFDANGELLLNGNTGISAAIKSDLQAIIGQKRIIPIFTKVSGNGNNAWYTIVRFEGVRILDVELTGAMEQKRLIVQPAPMIARSGIVSFDANTSSDYLYTPVMLVE